MDWTGCDVVEVVPGKVSGAPILKHSRVQADTVLESYELGELVEEIAYSFSLDPEDIRKVLPLRSLGNSSPLHESAVRPERSAQPPQASSRS